MLSAWARTPPAVRREPRGQRQRCYTAQVPVHARWQQFWARRCPTHKTGQVEGGGCIELQQRGADGQLDQQAQCPASTVVPGAGGERQACAGNRGLWQIDCVLRRAPSFPNGVILLVCLAGLPTLRRSLMSWYTTWAGAPTVGSLHRVKGWGVGAARRAGAQRAIGEDALFGKDALPSTPAALTASALQQVGLISDEVPTLGLRPAGLTGSCSGARRCSARQRWSPEDLQAGRQAGTVKLGSDLRWKMRLDAIAEAARPEGQLCGASENGVPALAGRPLAPASPSTRMSGSAMSGLQWGSR